MTAETPIPKPARSAGRRRTDRPAAFGFLGPSAAGLTIFVLFPSVLAIVTSLFDWPTFGEVSFVGGENYAALFQPGNDFVPAVINTVVFTAIVVPANLVLTVAMAFWVSTSRWKQLYRVLYFLPVVTPSVATAIIWKLLYQPDGVVDWLATSVGLEMPNLLGDQSTALIAVVVVILWQGFGYNMLIFSAAIDQLPEDVISAASLDGAGRVRQLLQIKLPLMTPALFFASTVTMIQAFQIFNEPYVMTAGGPGTSTITVVMNVYQTAFQGGQLGAAAAPAMVLFAMILVVTLIQWWGQKKWVHYD